MEQNKLKNIVEAAVMIAEEPITADKILQLFPDEEIPTKQELLDAIAELQEDYQERGVELAQLASGYRFRARADYAVWMRRMLTERPPRYSRAYLETLALIAYRQPITRAEIEEIRGVAVSTNIVRALTDRDWVKIIGHKEVPGRPALLATTKKFLDDLNLTSLEELPDLAELQDLDKMEEVVQTELNLSPEEAEQAELNNEEQEIINEAELEHPSDEAMAELELDDVEPVEVDESQQTHEIESFEDELNDEESELLDEVDVSQAETHTHEIESLQDELDDEEADLLDQVDTSEKLQEHDPEPVDDDE